MMESLLAEKIICLGGGSTDGVRRDASWIKVMKDNATLIRSSESVQPHPSMFVIHGLRVLQHRIAKKEHLNREV
ncbi:hypothetical protein L195_g058785, partial [Trifolium pratense]